MTDLVTGAAIALSCLAAGYGIGRWVHLVAPRRRLRKRWENAGRARPHPLLLDGVAQLASTLRPGGHRRRRVVANPHNVDSKDLT